MSFLKMDEIVKKKRVINSKSFDSVVYLGEIFFENYGKDLEIVAVCDRIGYCSRSIDYGRGLFFELKNAIENQERSFAYKIGMKNDLREAIVVAKRFYVKNLRYVRICFDRSREMISLFDFGGRRKVRGDEMYQQIKSFYVNVLREDVLSELNKVGVTKDRILADKLLFDRVLEIDSLYRGVKADCKIATKVKRRALKKYLVWINRLKKLLKIEFCEKPAILEQLMIK